MGISAPVAIGSLIAALALGGCVTITIAPPAAAPAVATAPSAVESAPPAVVLAAPSALEPVAVAAAPVAAAPVTLASPAVASAPPALVPPPAPTVSTAQKIVAKAPAPPKPVAAPVKAATAPTLDLTSLETRLRATSAIGTFTKLSLKNQIGDLLDQFKTFHHGGAPPLPTLRQEYELLLLKVLSLLQDHDASLASAISASRESIWGLLVDPAKFAKLG
jgi:hypothetical protein